MSFQSFHRCGSSAWSSVAFAQNAENFEFRSSMAMLTCGSVAVAVQRQRAMTPGRARHFIMRIEPRVCLRQARRRRRGRKLQVEFQDGDRVEAGFFIVLNVGKRSRVSAKRTTRGTMKAFWWKCGPSMVIPGGEIRRPFGIGGCSLVNTAEAPSRELRSDVDDRVLTAIEEFVRFIAHEKQFHCCLFNLGSEGFRTVNEASQRFAFTDSVTSRAVSGASRIPLR
jgi:hypothetical protein